MIELRAQIGEPRTPLAEKQGCSCFLHKDGCLVHGDVVAYVVEFTYIGRKRLLTGPNSFIHIPIKYEVKFYDSFEEAVGEWTTAHDLLNTSLFKKGKAGEYESLNKLEHKVRNEIAETYRHEVEGTEVKMSAFST